VSEILGSVRGVGDGTQELGIAIGWNGEAIISRPPCQPKCKRKLTCCRQDARLELVLCLVESESYASEFLGIQEPVLAVVGIFGGSRMGFQGDGRLVLTGGSIVDGVGGVVVAGRPNRVPVSAYRWDEQGGG
jgi:hypothetical protein